MNSTNPAGFRRANNDEEAALKFTFGDWMGKRLINLIRIRTGKGESRNQNEVLLHERYKSEELAWLGIFIYKATRVWQKTVGRYHQRKGGSKYNYKELYDLKKLNGKEHARAVRDWFYVSYGNAHRLIGSGPQRLTVDELWMRLFPVLGLDFDEHRWVFGWENDLQQVVNNHYGCVIEDIRDTSKFQLLGQNYPNPA